MASEYVIEHIEADKHYHMHLDPANFSGEPLLPLSSAEMAAEAQRRSNVSEDRNRPTSNAPVGPRVDREGKPLATPPESPEEPSEAGSGKAYDDLKLPELQELAARRGIDWQGVRKADLIEALEAE